MKLRRVTFGFSGIALLSLALNAALLGLILRTHGEAVRAQEQRQRAHVLASGLQQEAGQLAAYWKDVAAGRPAVRRQSAGSGFSAAARLPALGLGAAELAALARVQAATASLQLLDLQAYDAVRGTGSRSARLELAGALVHSGPYQQLQSGLAGALAELAAATELRTRAQLETAQRRLDYLITATLACLLGSLALVLVAAWVLQRQVLRPIRALSRAAAALAAGDYSVRVGGPGASEELDDAFGVQELAALGSAYNGMACAIERDLHQRATVQQELEQARQYSDDASRAKSMFLANMSHEIRTPMNAIIGMAYLALQSGLTPRQHGYVAQVHQAATALLALLNDILDFSKVEAGKMELSPAPFQLEQVLADALALVQPRAQEKGLELVLDLGERELVAGGGMLVGDALRLGQVLTNLLSNAVKFTEQGSIRLLVQLERREAGKVALHFTVRDTGIGMDTAQLARLFQEFTQADGSTTRKYGGTGLGLAISHKLVGLMGGRISADSRPGDGARFSAVVPLACAPAGPAPEPALPPDVAALRVLVVDDLPATRLALQNLLRAAGVDGAIDVVAGLPAARARLEAAQQWRRPYQLLLLDWDLTEQDCAAWLAGMAAEGLPLPPVAALTVGDPALAEEACAAPYLQGCLAKPVQPAGLRQLLAGVLGVAPPVRSVQAACAPDLHGMRVLLVEDQPANRQLACELLAMQGVRVEAAEHGAAALERLRARGPAHFHAVLMDVQMPVMDGYEATRQLRREPSFAGLPVIAMTAHAMAEERERCAAAGMTGHLCKPVEPAALYAALARHFGGAESLGHAGPARPQPPAGADGPGGLAAVPGLDAVAGLRRAGGQLALYRSLLADFAQQCADFPAALGAQLACGAWQEAERRAHTLHGLAATLGADQVGALAAHLERDCRARGSAAANASLARLAPPLLKLAAELLALGAGEAREPALPTAGLCTGGACEPSALPDDWLPQLRAMAAACDSGALALWAACRHKGESLLGRAAARRLGTALEQFDFDQALAVLSAVPQLEPIP